MIERFPRGSEAMWLKFSHFASFESETTNPIELPSSWQE